MTIKTRKIYFNLSSLALGFIAATLLFPTSGGLSSTTYSDLKQEFLRVKNYEEQLKEYESELKEKATLLGSLIDSLQLPEEERIVANNQVNSHSGDHSKMTDHSFDPRSNTSSNNFNKIALQSRATVDELSIQLERLKVIPIGAPVIGQISSHYGNRTSPFSKREHFHSGIDISAPHGTPVAATANGTVIKVGWEGAYGKMVTIDHGFGLKTSYAHLSNISVKEGAKIVRGQTIGNVGTTGRTTGAHLHYEVKLNDKYLDPQRFVHLAQEVKELGTKI